jgi:acyl-CoA dehydrogenase
MFGISEGRMGMASTCLGPSTRWTIAGRCQRRTFSVPWPSTRRVRDRRMAMEIMAAKYTIIHTAQMLDAGKVPVKEICISKALSIEMCQRAYDRAIQIHGGMGLSSELSLEEGFRIARTARIPDGTSEIQRRTIFRQLQRGDVNF